MTPRIPRTVAHLAKNDPDHHVGGVSAFARNLRLVFDDVVMFTPERHDWERVVAERIPVICDNQWVQQAPAGIPVVGFQHGVAEVKRGLTKTWTDRRLARAQKQAAARPNTLWVACAQWISDTFGSLYGNPAAQVIYHQVDLSRFDGQLQNAGSKLVLHDARSPHKGQVQMGWLEQAFPEWQFEALNCEPTDVPERMRRAAAFVHLSRYEGNSIVCNEAMAQNLPCLFTRVGLMQDAAGPKDIQVIDPTRAFDDRDYLVKQTGSFLGSLQSRQYRPRDWVAEHASLEANIAAWRRAMAAFDALAWP